jgi:hypothetical protein
MKAESTDRETTMTRSTQATTTVQVTRGQMRALLPSDDAVRGFSAPRFLSQPWPCHPFPAGAPTRLDERPDNPPETISRVG